MVLLAPAFGFNSRWPERLGPAEMARWKASDCLPVYHHGFKDLRLLSYDLVDDAAAYPDYPDFDQPALIFHGQSDDVVPVEFSVRFAGDHPNANLEIVPSGHDLLTVLDQISPQIIDFLTK
jgi:hypothetical protein